MVTVTQARGETVTSVDDGTNTTRVFEDANGHNAVRVTNDATGKVVGGYVGSASNISVGGEHVTINKSGGNILTTVDNGTHTATVNQNGASTSVSVSKDAAGGFAGMIATIEKMLQGQKAAAATSTTAATAGTSAGATPGTATAAGTASTATASGATSSPTAASSSSVAGPTDLAGLMALSPDQFMQAVTSGKIPPDVANDQSAMMQVQARMNQITQMNQLVTSMMAAAHQMQMSIIQNIRC
jgi:hypothetical protein